jgi:hypothetical protein
MTIYFKYKTRTKINYRKIYESHFGKIPKDEHGRSYEIHHIDGNSNNNEITNLMCISKQDHFDIHYKQGDWGACFLISSSLQISPEEKSRIAKELALIRMKNGTHNFLNKNSNENRVKDGTHNFLGGEIGGRTSRRRVSEGTHIFLGGELQKKQVMDGKNKLVGGELQKKWASILLEQNRHHSQKERVCQWCHKSCLGNAFFRYHGDNCKKKV